MFVVLRDRITARMIGAQDERFYELKKNFSDRLGRLLAMLFSQ